MTTKTENLPAVQEGSALPELYGSVTSVSDIQLPEIRVAADMSDSVRAGIAKPGDVLLMMGSDDPDPHFLIDGTGKDGPDSFTCYLIGRSPFAATMEGKKIVFQKERDMSDPDSWNGYFFTVAIPDVDDSIPARIMAWRTAWRGFTRSANFYIAKAVKEGSPPPHVKFTVSTKTSGEGFTYFVPKCSLIPADAGLEAAIEMSKFAQSVRYENDSPAEDPASDSTLPAI